MWTAVNGPDIIGFSSNGVVMSLSNGFGHFAAPEAVLSQFGKNVGGWTSQDQYPRFLANVDGANGPDIIGFSSNGVVVSLSDGSGHFAAPDLVLSQFGTNVEGWTSQDTYPRLLDDINGDDRADIVGFSSTGVVISLNDGSGHFASPQLVLPYFGSNAGGWTSQDTYPRLLADVNRDGMADIVGFSSTGVIVSLATGGGGFAAPTSGGAQFGTNAGGWASQNQFPRALADLAGDGTADIVGFSSTEVVIAPSYDYVYLDGPTAPVFPAVIA